MRKLYTYVDETGQDTKGNMTHVLILISQSLPQQRQF